MFDKELSVLKTIVQNTKHADTIMRDLAEIGRDKKTNDLVRRRHAINSNYGLKLSKEEIEEVYREFQRAGWGKLAIGRGSGVNSRFTWRIDYRELARAFVASGGADSRKGAIRNPKPFAEVFDAMGQARGAQTLQVASDPSLNDTFVFKLRSSGSTLKLTRGEMLELDELIREIK